MARSPQVIIIDPDPHRREEVRKALALSGVAVVGTARYGAEARTICSGLSPDVIVMALVEPLPRALQMVEAIVDMAPGIPILAYSPQRSPELVRQAMILGVRDFLPYPTGREELLRAIHTLIDLQERRRERAAQGLTPFGSVITVFGPKGGVGKTTIATNLAVAMAQRLYSSVALVDLDVRFGNVATVLGLSAERSIVDLAQNGHTPDLEQVRQCMVTHASGVDILPAPEWRGEWYPLTPDHVGAILHALAQSYDFVVVDTPAGFNDFISRALELSTLALLVTSPDVTGLKEALTVLEMLRDWSYPQERVVLVLNHAVAAKVSDGEVRSVLGIRPAWRIPFDKEVMRSLREGRPLVSRKPRSRAAVAITAMAFHVAGQPSVPRQGVLARILRRQAVAAR